MRNYRSMAFVAGLLCLPCSVFAGGSGTITATSKSVVYAAGPYVVPKPAALTSAITGKTPGCQPTSMICDVYTLSVVLPADYAATHPSDRLVINVSWADRSADFDVFVYDDSGKQIAAAVGSDDPQSTSVPALGGTHQYQIHTIPNFPKAQSIVGNITLKAVSAASQSVSLGGPALDVLAPPQQFENYDAGEPTIGVMRADDHAFLLAGTQELKLEFDDTTSPADTTWSDVSDPTSSQVGTEDPFLTADAYPKDDGTPSPLIVVAQLHGTTSILSKTKDEGQTWQTSIASGLVNGEDHESIAIGPYPSGLRPKTALAQHALYYCSHAIANAFCSRSDTGGATFNPGVPIWPAQVPDYSYSTHGMVKVGADGTVYVPAGGGLLGGGAAVTLSTDAGLTWHFSSLPGGVPTSDPSIAIAADGKTLYVAYVNGFTAQPFVIKGTLDKADALNPRILWDPAGAVALGVPAGLNNASFPTAVAGDPARVAVAFLGTTTSGSSNDAVAMKDAAWYLYVATSYDGGKTWQLQNATRSDPVQRGAICQGGATAGCDTRPDRNLLDFIHVTTDSKGRILVAFADGCTHGCANPGGVGNYTASPTAVRQVGGRPLYARYDTLFAEPAVPKAPLLSGDRTTSRTLLSWSPPYGRGSAVSSYNVYRSIIAGKETLLAQIVAPGYSDSAALDPNTNYFYRVTAVNALGESALSNEIEPTLPVGHGSPCVLPGVQVVSSHNTSTPFPYTTLEYGAIAEPYFDGVLDLIVFTLKVQGLPVVPPGMRWSFLFQDGIAPANGDSGYFVSMASKSSGVQFNYGTQRMKAVTVDQLWLFQNLGTLDAMSGYSPDGTIVLALPRSALPGLLPGKTLTNITAIIVQETSRGDLSMRQQPGDASYPIVGNAACKP